MKINVEVECSPEEARAFLGLPDLRPMQDAVLAKMQQQMMDAVEAVSPDFVAHQLQTNLADIRCDAFKTGA